MHGNCLAGGTDLAFLCDIVLAADDAKIGFPATARKYADALTQNQLLAPAKSVEDMHRIVNNNDLDALLTGVFMALVVAAVAFGVRSMLQARASAQPTVNEEPYVALTAAAH